MDRRLHGLDLSREALERDLSRFIVRKLTANHFISLHLNIEAHECRAPGRVTLPDIRSG